MQILSMVSKDGVDYDVGCYNEKTSTMYLRSECANALPTDAIFRYLHEGKVAAQVKLNNTPQSVFPVDWLRREYGKQPMMEYFVDTLEKTLKESGFRVQVP